MLSIDISSGTITEFILENKKNYENFRAQGLSEEHISQLKNQKSYDLAVILHNVTSLNSSKIDDAQIEQALKMAREVWR